MPIADLEVETTMARLERKRFDEPDETRSFMDKGRMDIVNIGGGVFGRSVLEPGWVWSEHVGPTAGSVSCQEAHLRYVISGRLAVTMDDGTELVFDPGDVASIPPGHDGRVVGDEPCVVLDLGAMAVDPGPPGPAR